MTLTPTSELREGLYWARQAGARRESMYGPWFIVAVLGQAPFLTMRGIAYYDETTQRWQGFSDKYATFSFPSYALEFGPRIESPQEES
jgi:hypothetical protein